MSEPRTELQDAVKAMRSEIQGYSDAIAENKQVTEELRSRVVDAETKVQTAQDALVKAEKRAGRMVLEPGRKRSLGQVFVESDEFKNFDAQRGKRSDDVVIGNMAQYYNAPVGRRDLSSGAASGGALVQEQRVPGIIGIQNRSLTIRDLMPQFRATSNTIEWVKETQFNQLSAELTTPAASAQADIAVENANGFFVGQTIYIDRGGIGGGTEEIKLVSSIDLATNVITLTTNLANLHATGVEVSSDTFVFTPETQLKPKANAVYAPKTSIIKTLAHFIPATRQLLADANNLRAHIDMRLVEGLKLMEETQFLYGDGSANQIDGILTDPDVQSYSWSSGTVGDKRIDALRRAMTLAFLANYPVTGIVMNPVDWEDVELTKGTDGHYIWMGAPGAGAGAQVWRVPVVVTTAINSGDALVGAFNLGSALWDREDAIIRVSDSHKDYFQRNMVALLAEERLTQTLYRPESFVAVDFDSAP